MLQNHTIILTTKHLECTREKHPHTHTHIHTPHTHIQTHIHTYTHTHAHTYHTHTLCLHIHRQMNTLMSQTAAILIASTPSYNLTDILDERMIGDVMLFQMACNVTLQTGRLLQTEIVKTQCSPILLKCLKSLLPQMDVAKAGVTTRNTSTTTTVIVSQPNQWVKASSIAPHAMLKWLLSKPKHINETITKIIKKESYKGRMIYTVEQTSCEVQALKSHIPKKVLDLFKKPKKRTTRNQTTRTTRDQTTRTTRDQTTRNQNKEYIQNNRY
jgi:hypothetical protein